jgi:hypothetical protein
MEVVQLRQAQLKIVLRVLTLGLMLSLPCWKRGRPR